MSRDQGLDAEAKRLKSAARKSKRKSEKSMLEGFSKFYDALADERGEVAAQPEPPKKK
jgi:hypothetical protein